MEDQLLTDGFEDSWNYFLDAICKTKQAALYIFVIISQYFVQFIEKLDLLLNHCHPTEVEFEEKKECQDALSTDDYVLMLKEFEESLQKHLLLEQNGADLWVINIVERKVQHGDECLLNTRLAVSVEESLTKPCWCDSFEDHREELWVQFADMAESYCSGYSDSIIPLLVCFIRFLWILFHEVDLEDLLYSHQICKSVSS